MDIGCERSEWADCGEAIAKALGAAADVCRTVLAPHCTAAPDSGFCYAFVAEFEELHSPLRTPETQGGGVHGQALLSRFPLVDVRAIVHSHQPVDWDAEGCVARVHVR